MQAEAPRNINTQSAAPHCGVETEDVEEVLLIAESIVKSYQHVDCGQTARTAAEVLPMARAVWRSAKLNIFHLSCIYLYMNVDFQR